MSYSWIIDGLRRGLILSERVRRRTVETDFCNLSQNTAQNASENGLYFYLCQSNRIDSNNIRDNVDGVRLEECNDILITRNNVTNNQNWTIHLISCHDCNIFLNNFSGITPLGIDINGSNSWDNGTHGNYWSDYLGYDGNGDGIGDTPYLGDGFTDHYPLVSKSSPADNRIIVIILFAAMALILASIFIIIRIKKKRNKRKLKPAVGMNPQEK